MPKTQSIICVDRSNLETNGAGHVLVSASSLRAISAEVGTELRLAGLFASHRRPPEGVWRISFGLLEHSTEFKANFNCHTSHRQTAAHFNFCAPDFYFEQRPLGGL